MSLYYVEDQGGEWQWVEAESDGDAARVVAGPLYEVDLTKRPPRSYPVTRYTVRDGRGRRVNRLDVTHEKHLAGKQREGRLRHS